MERVDRNGDSVQESMWIEIINRMESVYAVLAKQQTDLEHKNIELAKAKEFIEKILNAMTDVVILMTPDGMVTRANRSTLSILGYEEGEILNHPLRKILKTPAIEKAHLSMIEPSRGTSMDEILTDIEGVLIPREGDPIPVSVRSSVFRDDFDDVSGIVVVVRDLRPTKKLIAEAAMAEAERRKAEELRHAYEELKQLQEQLIQSEKMASIGQIAAGVAHEINNPISGIMVYLHMLIKDIENNRLDNQQTFKFLTDSRHELTRCSRIIKSLLDFSRQSHPKLAPVDLSGILTETFSILGHKAKLQDIEIVQDIEPELPHIQADADQLQQVFLNLILNAIQAMPHGGQLTIRAKLVDDQEALTKCPKAIRIDIQDTGCGIAEENVSKVFTPFFTTKEKGEGVGLGLAVVYGIVRRHGGHISFKNLEDQGTVFSILFGHKEALST